MKYLKGMWRRKIARAKKISQHNLFFRVRKDPALKSHKQFQNLGAASPNFLLF